MKGLWLVAGLLGLTAATLTWIIGFPLATGSYAASLPTTTLALVIGMGAILMWDKRYRRWAWIAVLVGAGLGPFVRGASRYFLSGPLELCVLCLIFVMLAALTTPRSKPSLDKPDDRRDD